MIAGAGAVCFAAHPVHDYGPAVRRFQGCALTSPRGALPRCRQRCGPPSRFGLVCQLSLAECERHQRGKRASSTTGPGPATNGSYERAQLGQACVPPPAIGWDEARRPRVCRRNCSRSSCDRRLAAGRRDWHEGPESNRRRRVSRSRRVTCACPCRHPLDADDNERGRDRARRRAPTPTTGADVATGSTRPRGYEMWLSNSSEHQYSQSFRN